MSAVLEKLATLREERERQHRENAGYRGTEPSAAELALERQLAEENEARLIAEELEKVEARRVRRASKIQETQAALDAALEPGGVIREYSELREKWENDLAQLAWLTGSLITARREYEEVWERAEKLGLDVPVRIPPAAQGGNAASIYYGATQV